MDQFATQKAATALLTMPWQQPDKSSNRNTYFGPLKLSYKQFS